MARSKIIVGKEITSDDAYPWFVGRVSYREKTITDLQWFQTEEQARATAHSWEYPS